MKKLLSLLASSLVALSLTTPLNSFGATTSESVIVNGKYMTFNVDPIIDNSGYTLVEFRPIFTMLGLDVSYDSSTNTVSGGNNKTHIVFPVGNTQASVNDKTYTLPVASEIVNGHTMVPLRFLSEVMGYIVKWDGETNTVIISNESSQPQSAPEVAQQQTTSDTQTVKVYVNDKDIQANPVLSSLRVSGIVYAPFNDILKYLVQVGDDISANDTNTEVRITHNGVKTTIPESVYNNKGYLPVADVAKLYGATVVDNGDNVQITTPTTTATN